MLFEPKVEPEKWGRVKEAAFGFISKNLSLAPYMYGIASQIYGLPRIEFDTTVVVTAEVEVDGQRYASHVVRPIGKKGIRQEAVLEILSQVVRGSGQNGSQPE